MSARRNSRHGARLHDEMGAVSMLCVEAVRLVCGLGALALVLLASEKWWAILRAAGII